MRILQVVHGFPPFNAAGAELVAHGLSRALVDLGHDVTVFHRVADPERPEYDVERARVDGLPVVRVNNNFRDCDRFERTYRNPEIDAIFADLLDRERPDVVHFHHVTCLSTNLVAVARSRDIPVVFTLHDYWLICQRGQYLKRDLSVCPGQDDGECVKCLAWQLNLRGGSTRLAGVLKRTVPSLGAPRAVGARRLLKAAWNTYARVFFSSQGEARERVRRRMEHVRQLCRDVDFFLSPSEFLRQEFIRFGVPAEKIAHSRLGFDHSYFSTPAGGITPEKPGHIRFGFLGTWIPPKGLHVLVEAFNGIDDPRASLHVFGHAIPYEDHEDYVRHVKGLVRSPRIFFEGEYENRSVGEILSGLDVLVVPSIWYENSPMTIQEAFLAGVPVVAADFGGMAELVRDGVNGLTFPPRDAGGLREALARLLREPELLSSLRRGVQPVRSLEDFAEEHVGLYERLSHSVPEGATERRETPATDAAAEARSGG